MDEQLAAQPRITDYIRPLTARWWIVVVAVVVATVVVYAYESHKPDVYTASTLVYYQDPGDPINGTLNAPQTDRNVLDEASLLYSRGTAAIVAPQIGWHGSVEDLLKTVSITSKPGEDFIEVTSQAGTAGQAAAIANAYGRTLVSLLIGNVKNRLQRELGVIQQELAALPPVASNVAQRAQLQIQQSQLQVAIKAPPLISRQVDPALPPGSPSSPKPTRDALFAFVLSLIASIALVYWIERFDRHLKNPEEMERAYGRPLVSVLPHTPDPNAYVGGEAALGHEFREPFRVLRTNLELASLDAPPRTIVVSSAMPGEGKSTVVRNLALAFRESGKSVVVVDLDLRHPTLGRTFNQQGGAGVTEVLRHERELDEAIVRVSVGLDPLAEFLLVDAEHRQCEDDENSRAVRTKNGNGSVGNGSSRGQRAEIGLLLAGSRAANPTVVLASERVVEMLDELTGRYDLVLIDSAPLLAVSDTVPLLRYADAALFVGRLEVTTRDTARRLMEFVKRVPGLNLLGIVANDLSRIDASGYGYGYGYGSYGHGAEASPRRRRSRLSSGVGAGDDV